MKIPGFILLCTLIFSSCSLSGNKNNSNIGSENPNVSNIDRGPYQILPKLPTRKDKEEKSFNLPMQNGKNTTAYIYSDPQKTGGKVVIFEPFLEKTDGNLYNAALHILPELNARKDVFQLSDAKTEADAELGGNAICWDIHKPEQKFCVFPVKDSESGGIGVVRAWVK